MTDTIYTAAHAHTKNIAKFVPSHSDSMILYIFTYEADEYAPNTQ